MIARPAIVTGITKHDKAQFCAARLVKITPQRFAWGNDRLQV
jgi:hypothetical protein